MQNDGFEKDAQLLNIRKVDPESGDPIKDNPDEIRVISDENAGIMYVEREQQPKHGCTACLTVLMVIVLSSGLLAGAFCNYFLNNVPETTAAPPCPTIAADNMIINAKSRIKEGTDKNICLTKQCVKTGGRMLEYMDESVDPCVDFYQYSCGNWLRNNPIPADKSRYGVLDFIQESNSNLLKSIMESSPETVPSEAERKSLQMYAECMDIDARDSLGVQPVIDMLSSMGGWNSLGDIDVHVLSTILKEYNVKPFFNVMVGIDDFDSTRSSIMIDQPMNVLPDPSYYLRNESHDEIIVGYKAYINIILTELGLQEPTLSDIASEIWDFEVALAKIFTPDAERRDILKMYNKVTISELQGIAPEFDWLSILKTVASPTEVDDTEEVIIYATGYLQRLSSLVENTDPRIAHNYMMWRVASSYLVYTSSKMHDAYNQISNTVTGATAAEETWKTCYGIVSTYLDTAVSEMVTSIKTAFKSNLLEAVDWMSDETKHAAIEKVNAMGEKVAYPEYLLDPEELDSRYEEFEVVSASFVQSMVNCASFSVKVNMKHLHRPVDLTEWPVAPQVLNAFYVSTMNEMVILAGILQPTLFDSESLWALNYGGIGYVIAHELIHGFDTRGRLYNKHGTIAPWWSEESSTRFEQRAQCVINLYDGYEVEGTNTHVNGNLTLAENIADLGAIRQSYNAYKSWTSMHGEEQLLPGLGMSNEQVFFLAFAQVSH
uniref:Endothelin-converting enzyme 2-like n=1 Tax=Saccoglossus kowalevskii TaxID=10224 RepID=A0ABM0MIQ0_SACKO|nr:PREDICTED: endothelin-converting enzyme 2-like [Saccoglossus kowalevskii]